MAGLEAGADDYITKPFSLAVLRARVNAQLRRAAPAQPERLEVDGFTFDFARLEFAKDGSAHRPVQDGAAAAAPAGGEPGPHPAAGAAAGAGVGRG